MTTYIVVRGDSGGLRRLEFLVSSRPYGDDWTWWMDSAKVYKTHTGALKAAQRLNGYVMLVINGSK
jgi:hypothetical protein